MKMKQILSFFWLIVILTLPLGCVTHTPTSTPPGPPRVSQAYDGPELDAKQIAIVHNDERAYISIKGKNATESYTFKPGKQTIPVEYSRVISFGNRIQSERSKEPISIETTLEAGHEYQVVCYEGMGIFSAVLADVTTDEGVLEYLQIAPEYYQKKRAVNLLRSQSRIKDIALQYPSSSVREWAVDRLDSRDVLGQVIENDINPYVCKRAEARLRELAATPAPERSSEGKPASGTATIQGRDVQGKGGDDLNTSTE